MYDVVEEVAEGRAVVEWATVTATHGDLSLEIKVMRDAMRFNLVPDLRWNLTTMGRLDPNYTGQLHSGVRLPASAYQLQHIADLTGSVLLTPKVIDLIWQQANHKLNPVVNVPLSPGSTQRSIVAISPVHVVHKELEQRMVGATGLVDGIGKYWCLTKALEGKPLTTACNYGWLSENAPYKAVTPGLSCWQSPGYRHDDRHSDPSQVIRLMYRSARLTERGRTLPVDVEDILKDAKYSVLLTHDGPLKATRQRSVPRPAVPIAIPGYLPGASATSMSSTV